MECCFRFVAVDTISRDGPARRWHRNRLLAPEGRLHGAASRVAVSETAFGQRRDHLMVEIIAGWEHQSAGEDGKPVQWAQRGSRALAPYSLQGGYVNLLDVTEQERVPLAFGPNFERVRDVKRTYDSDDVFESTIGHITPRTL
jgi:Berberine and berberine like